MPKTFNEYERAAIKESMLKVGAALMRKKGIRQIAVEDITRGVNIAKGSFYSFYESRELLFWDIIKREERHLIDQILAIASQDDELRKKVRKVFYDLYLDDNCIIYFLPPEDIEYVLRKLPPEIVAKNRDNGLNANGMILSAFGLEGSRENVEILTTMLRLLRDAKISEVPSSDETRGKVLGILVEGLVGYFCK